MAQQQAIDFAPTAQIATIGDDMSSLVLVDSIFYDQGDNSPQFTIGFGFPGPDGQPSDPGEARAGRYVPAVQYTVPADRTTPFVLTGMRLRYRTSTVSATTTTPPRVQYDADVNPQYAVFRDLAPIPLEDSTSAEGSITAGELPFSTATVISTADQYPVPIPQSFLISFVEDGATTVTDDFIFQPGESFTIRLQFFNVPFPMQVEAGPDPLFVNRSVSFQATAAMPDGFYGPLDLLTFNGLNVADTGGTDGLEDQWYMRALSDDSFFPATSGEQEAAYSRISLGNPSPNPARSMIDLPFALRDGGAARVSVYDALGREVSVVADRAFGAGGQNVQFDTSRLAPGVYVVVLEANGVRATQRLSVVR